MTLFDGQHLPDTPTDLLVGRIVSSFDLPPDHVRRVAHRFVQQMRDGLSHVRPYQLPSYVTAVPDGSETGHFLSVDLGGTNCRICLVTLRGDATFDVQQTKCPVPVDLMVNESHLPLFSFIAARIREFLERHRQPSAWPAEAARFGVETNRLPLGFTFSFTCEQTSLRGGTLLHWDKGWDIPSALGRDPVTMLQDALDAAGVPVFVAALVNDTVGTLMTRAYMASAAKSTSSVKTHETERHSATLAGVIFGTGTNAAYVERTSQIERLQVPGDELRAEHDDGGSGGARSGSDSNSAIMIVNTEWGCFDDDMQVLPRTTFDDLLDAASGDPGAQMFEKRVSGMYLGELFRLVLLHLKEAGALQLSLEKESPARRPGAVDASILSAIALGGDEDHEDGSQGLKDQRIPTQVIATLGVVEGTMTVSDLRAMRSVAAAIGRRAGRLAGAALSAVVIQSGWLERRPGGQGRPRVCAAEEVISDKNDSSHRAPTRRKAGRRARSLYIRLRDMLHGLLTWLSGRAKGNRAVGLSSDLCCPKATASSSTQASEQDTLEPSPQGAIGIGADGSLIELYEPFEAYMREAMREVPQIGPTGERKVQIGLAKGGSAIGAALIAQAAMVQGR